MSAVEIEYKREAIKSGERHVFVDIDSGEEVVVHIEGWAEGPNTHGPLVSIEGVLTVGQLWELAYKLTGCVTSRPPDVMEVARMKGGESLSLEVSG